MNKGQGTNLRRKQGFPGDRGTTFGYTDLQFMHQASEGDTGINLAELNPPAGWTGNPNPSTIRSVALNMQSNLELYSGSGRRMAPAVSFTASGTQITFQNDYIAGDGEIFFGTIRNVPRTGAEFLDGAIKQTTGFLTPGSHEFNVGWEFPMNEGEDYLRSLRVHRNRKQQLHNVTGEDADYEGVRAGSSDYGTYIRFNDPGTILPSGLPEIITVESRKIIIDRNTNSLRSEMENQQGIIFRIADFLDQNLGVPLSDLMFPNPTQIQLKQFGDLILGMLDLQIPISEPWTTTRTFTPSPGFGTVTDQSYRTKRVGDTLFFGGQLRIGTPSAVTAYLGLPSGLKADSSKIDTSNLRDLRGKLYKLEDSAANETLSNTGGQDCILTVHPNNLDRITIAYQSVVERFNEVNVNAIWGVTERITWDGHVPIEGWAETQSVREFLEGKGIL